MARASVRPAAGRDLRCDDLFCGLAGSALVLILLLVPLVPLILMQEIRRWQRLPPAATASAAMLSIAVSGGFYWMLYYRMR
jgi:hypothetical protein